MTMGYRDLSEVPEETKRVAKLAFPKGNKYLMIRDRLGEVYQGKEFKEIYAELGQGSEAPGMLALVTVLQYMENLSDRQAAEQVRGRLDWKYLLGLELTDAGFNYSVLSEFRERLLRGGGEEKLLELLLKRFQEEGWLKERGQQRTDATQVLGKVRELNRLELVGEGMRNALNTLAVVLREWLREHAPLEWFERYQGRMEMYRLPKGKEAQEELGRLIGVDGYYLFELMAQTNVPDWVRELPAIEALRQIWVQQYQCLQGVVVWRETGNVPPGALMIQSPYDLEVRQSEKRNKTWRGYKVHLTETYEDDLPHLITNVETTLATEPDCNLTQTIHQHLQDKNLLPILHTLDQGYTSAENLLNAHQVYQLDLLGPVSTDTSWQASQQTGYDQSAFDIDWLNHLVTCPQGQLSHSWSETQTADGYASISVRFAQADCTPCPARSLCTRSVSKPRSLKLRPQDQFLALQAARQRQLSPEFKDLYHGRAGVEGTISQAVRSFGFRQARYLGLAKTHLQLVCTSASINLARLADYLADLKPAPSRVSKLASFSPP